jgi:hypothetical protein
MKELFASYEQSLQLKQLGFDELCFKLIKPDGNLESLDIEEWKIVFGTIVAPLKQQVLRWFRDKHNLVSWVYIGNVDRYFYTIIEDGRFVVDHKVYPTYEEAEDACINKLIEIIKEK